MIPHSIPVTQYFQQLLEAERWFFDENRKILACNGIFDFPDCARVTERQMEALQELRNREALMAQGLQVMP